MNRKHKIIVSVVGIFIILLALLGITYGYFLTRIVGNTNDTSVYITTANLRLVYGDGNGIVYAYNIQPNNEFVTFVDENGNMLGQTKTFTVKNEGNQRVDYEVYLEDVINNFVHYDDLVLKISCVSNIEGNTCNGYDNIYPVENSKLIMNSISPVDESKNTPAEIHTYTLTLKFLDDGDQSDDMGKTLQGKVQIYDPKDVIAISGEVTNYTDGDYAEIHSDVKKSQIRKVVENGETKYTYKFYGVKQTETHKIYLKNSNLSDEINETRFQQIKISKDETNDIVSNNEIVVNENTETVDVNITVNNSDNSIGLNINEIVDNTNTDLLRDKIILNNVVWKDNNLDL